MLGTFFFFSGEDFPSHVIHPAKERLDTFRAWEKEDVRATDNSDERRMVDLRMLLKLPPSHPSSLRSFSRRVFFGGEDFSSHVIHPAKERLDTFRAWEKKDVQATD